jgi:hypothetical protein
MSLFFSATEIKNNNGRLSKSNDLKVCATPRGASMSAGPEETVGGLRLASNGNVVDVPRTTEKLARLRRARKETARDDKDAQRRLNDYDEMNALHAQLDLKLRERNERRAALLRVQSERVGIGRETRVAHAASARDVPEARRLETTRGQTQSRNEQRRAEFQRRRHSATETRWTHINETAAEDASRTPRLRETRSQRDTTTADHPVLAVTENGNNGVSSEPGDNLAAARESLAARNNAVERPSDSTSEFEFAVVTPTGASRSFRDCDFLRVARDTDLRSLANEVEVLEDILEEIETRETPTRGTSESETLNASVGSVYRTCVKPGGVAWRSPPDTKDSWRTARFGFESALEVSDVSFSSPNRTPVGDESFTSTASKENSPFPSCPSPDFESRLRGVTVSRRRRRSRGKTEETAVDESDSSRLESEKAIGKRNETSPRSTPSGASLFAADSVDGEYFSGEAANGGEDDEVSSMPMRRAGTIVKELLAVSGEAVGVATADTGENGETVHSVPVLSKKNEVLLETETTLPSSRRGDPSSYGPHLEGLLTKPTWAGVPRRSRRATRREKKFGKLPFRVAGLTLEMTRKAGEGALRGVGGVIRALGGIVIRDSR